MQDAYNLLDAALRTHRFLRRRHALRCIQVASASTPSQSAKPRSYAIG